MFLVAAGLKEVCFIVVAAPLLRSTYNDWLFEK